VVAMFPDGPGSQNKNGVKTFFIQTIHSSASGHPPIKKEEVIQGSQGLWVVCLQGSEPDLSGENTCDQQVVCSFLNLIIKRVGSRVGKTFPGQAICCPNSVQCSCLKKEFALACAQPFQICSQGPKPVAPMKRAS